MLAAIAIGELARDQIGDSLNDPEAHDEGNDNRGRCDLELLRADEGDDRPLHSHHAADKGVDENQQRELSPVLSQAKLDAFRAREPMTRRQNCHPLAVARCLAPGVRRAGEKPPVPDGGEAQQ